MKNQFIAIIFAGLSSISVAQVADCDRLAASSLDPQKQSTGVSYDKLNANLAVPACKNAVTENPRIARLWFQYGRALEKANKLPDAIAAYQEAAKLNSGVAYNNLGELYRDGKGFQKDLKKAEEYFSKSAELNSPEGKDNLLGLQAQQRKAAALDIPKELLGTWAFKGEACKKTQKNWRGIVFTNKEYKIIRISDYNIGPDICIPQKISSQNSKFVISFNCKPIDDGPYLSTESFTVEGDQLKIDANGTSVWKRCSN